MPTIYDLYPHDPASDHQNPFPEPRMMPTYWDLSSLSTSASQVAASAQSDDQVGTGEPAQPPPAAPQDWRAPKFQEPTTPPENWDVSALR